MPITDPYDPYQDEALYKELVGLKGAHAAPHRQSPEGRRLYEGAARHEARIRSARTGRGFDVPGGIASGPRYAQPADDPASIRPNEALQKSLEDRPDDDAFKKAVAAQSESVQRIADRRRQIQKAFDEVDRLKAAKLAKSTDDAPTKFRIKVKGS